MAFATFADGSANLPGKLLDGITVLACEYTIDGEPKTYDGNLDAFDAHAYYQLLTEGHTVKTSLLNTQFFIDRFRPALESGLDVIYTSMASGISGTYQAAKLAAAELMEEFKERFIHIVDSKTCGLGIGMLAVLSAELSRSGMSAKEAAAILDDEVPHCCSYFTVDDLNFLKRTGRVSGATAMIGTVMNIKPILFGTDEANIQSCGVARGRKKAIDLLVDKYKKKAVEPEKRRVYISHGDCLEDAQRLAEKVCAVAQPKELVICKHEPFSGAHVGPGMLALFFHGSER